VAILLRLLCHGHIGTQHLPRCLERIPDEGEIEEVVDDDNDVIDLFGCAGKVGFSQSTSLRNCIECFLVEISD
jgi:hypothetical protein